MRNATKLALVGLVGIMILCGCAATEYTTPKPVRVDLFEYDGMPCIRLLMSNGVETVLCDESRRRPTEENLGENGVEL